MFSLNHWFSIQGDFVPPEIVGTIWRVLFVTTGGCYWEPVSRTRNDSTYPTMHKTTPTTRHDPVLVMGLRTTGLDHLACPCSFSTHLESEEGRNTFLNTTVELKTSRRLHAVFSKASLLSAATVLLRPVSPSGVLSRLPLPSPVECACLWPFCPPHFTLRYSPSLTSNWNIPPERCSDLKSAH